MLLAARAGERHAIIKRYNEDDDDDDVHHHVGNYDDDHDGHGSARRDTAIAPPRQICGCSD